MLIASIVTSKEHEAKDERQNNDPNWYQCNFEHLSLNALATPRAERIPTHRASFTWFVVVVIFKIGHGRLLSDLERIDT
ncbi:MAG: hypothetical protein JW384_00098 [Nitrosomonadaceae bacterium]|nr:hypothetical protein [Nitrosomonadaceae bacterium]